MAKGPKKPKAKDISRRRKKKVSVLTQEGIGYVDWKDINLLRRFMSDRAKIRARQVTGNNQQQQKEIARAIKNAREMALLPYNNRITTQRSASRMRDDSRFEGPVPQPSTPPPGLRAPGEMDPDDPEAAEMAMEGAPAEMPFEDVPSPVDAEPVDAGPAEAPAEEAPAPEPAAEEPVAEEPAAEEPPAEDAAAEEPTAEEAADEEPAS
ncbi:MAG: 30S ribosomal protein S18 [Acidimicrobiia bacterium]|nr:30S ribosomal protein S18 [Acidimicrobiia bacterium]MYE73323.1 30S ribosomal protein S18 [Acidimicrobiia bacterium]